MVLAGAAHGGRIAGTAWGDDDPDPRWQPQARTEGEAQALAEGLSARGRIL